MALLHKVHAALRAAGLKRSKHVRVQRRHGGPRFITTTSGYEAKIDGETVRVFYRALSHSGHTRRLDQMLNALRSRGLDATSSLDGDVVYVREVVPTLEAHELLDEGGDSGYYYHKDQADEVIDALANALRALMASEGGEPRDEDDSRKVWAKCEAALARSGGR